MCRPTDRNVARRLIRNNASAAVIKIRKDLCVEEGAPAVVARLQCKNENEKSAGETTTARGGHHGDSTSPPSSSPSVDGVVVRLSDIAPELSKISKPDSAEVEKRLEALRHLPTFRSSSQPQSSDDSDNGNAPSTSTSRLLGKGSFCAVYEVRSIDVELSKCDSNYFGRCGSIDKIFFTKTLDDNECDMYAMKCVRDDHKRRAADASPCKGRSSARRNLVLSYADLVSEACMLASLSYPHIVKIFGTSAPPSEAVDCFNDDHEFFMVLERLSCTLNDRLKVWRAREKEAHSWHFTRKGFFERLHIKNSQSSDSYLCHAGSKAQLLPEQLNVANQIASGMKYLQDHRIIYRDLKPHNIGFDREGHVKIFDFGLARTIPEDKYGLSGACYKLTGCTGSLRYMAPEVAKYQPYGLSADVYSFGVLLWQILFIRQPFVELRSRSDIYEHIVENGARPPLKGRSFPPRHLRTLLKRCWAENQTERPCFDSIERTILKERLAIAAEDEQSCSGGSGSGSCASVPRWRRGKIGHAQLELSTRARKDQQTKLLPPTTALTTAWDDVSNASEPVVSR